MEWNGEKYGLPVSIECLLALVVRHKVGNSSQYSYRTQIAATRLITSGFLIRAKLRKDPSVLETESWYSGLGSALQAVVKPHCPSVLANRSNSCPEQYSTWNIQGKAISAARRA